MAILNFGTSLADLHSGRLYDGEPDRVGSIAGLTSYTSEAVMLRSEAHQLTLDFSSGAERWISFRFKFNNSYYSTGQVMTVNDASGEPKFYSLTDESIELYPTPGDSYTLEMSYVRTIPALSDSNTSNWLLSEAPDVYLYGALVQSPGYLVEDQRLKTWAALYDQAVRQLNTSSVNAKFGSNLRIRSNQYWS